MHMDLRQAYKVLQVEFKTSFPKVTKAYRKLALKFHPDKCKEANAHERFNEIQKAYEYLKKNPPQDGRGDLFADSNQGDESPQQPEPNEFPLKLTLEEIFTGCTRQEEISIKVVDANGNERSESKTLQVEVKPGSIAGKRITINQEGDRYHGKLPSNVVFIIDELPHPQFRRIRFDLEYTSQLTTEEACLREVIIPTLDRKKLKLTINQVITQSSVERVPGKGLPIPDGNGKRGDLLIKFDIVYEKDMKQDPPIERDIYISLEQVLTGINKKMVITRSKIIDPNTGDESFEKKRLEIPIPPGIEPGVWRYSFPREGDRKPGTIPSDINFTIHAKVHSAFIRNGANLKYNALVSESEAREGIQLKIPTLEGQPILCTFKNGDQMSTVFKGRGLPLGENEKKRGDLLVTFKVGDDFKDPPVEHDLPISLKQIVKGCKKKMRITRKIFDREGNETGEDDEIVTIDIKPGAESGTRFVFPRMGDERPGRISSDIAFVLCAMPGESFKRKGQHVEYTLKISKSQLSSGALVKITDLNGDPLELSLDGIVKQSSLKRFKRQGLPLANDPSKRGDLIVRFEIVDEPQDLPIERDLLLTVEQMREGCKKKMKMNKLIMIDDSGRQIEMNKILEITVKPNTKAGDRITLEREGDQKPKMIPADIVFICKQKDVAKKEL